MAIEPLLATRAQKAFIITITTQAIVVLVMVAIVFRLVSVSDDVDFDKAANKTVPCFLALFALAEIFELVMAFDALRLRNVIQLVGILLFHLAIMVFAALQVGQTETSLLLNCNWRELSTCGSTKALWGNVKPFLIVVPCVISAAFFGMMFYVKQLYDEFGWAIFHIVGANPKMKTMYQWYQILICLLKFDFFCFTGVSMQLLIVVLATDTAEFGVTIAAIPIVLSLLIACSYAVQREVKWLMSISLVMMLAAQSYLYKLVRFYTPPSSQQYATTRATLTIFTIVAFILLFASFAAGLRCFADFDRGLQSSKVNAIQPRPQYLSSASSGNNMSEARQSSYTAGGPIAPRISIE